MNRTGPRIPALTAPLVVGAVRVVLGILWLNEGITKYRAGFGPADILLVAGSASGNSRVPEFFQWFATGVLGKAPELFGVLMPLLETGLGVALILGVLTLPAAVGSVVTLMTYWMADQLIAQYPVMVLLSLCVVLWPHGAMRFSLDALLQRIIRRRRTGTAGA
ncbi:DoxX family membrane protein [Arthrobacter woluwensis]|uniref:DoxX family membrane protein n=1 Tax=Arthrobacter woluwensis TaxID=156980 RepID=UPI0038127DDD